MDAWSPAIATYRVQFHAGFGFDDAAAQADYLAALGVSHLYSSPVLQAAPGSTHGYDVVDPNQLNPELGGEPAFQRLVAALEQHGLRQMLDIVPNHMAIGHPSNRWWWDVLENGRASAYAAYFDIDWDPPEAKLRNRILLPILADHYGKVLDAGDIRVVDDDGRLLVRYGDQVLPLNRVSVAPLLATAAPAAAAALNADKDRLHEVLEAQHYRLAYWRAGDRELDYRRFFDINTLVALRTEREQVFADVHRLVFDLIRQGAVHALRVDHVDGLANPAEYLAQVEAASGDVWTVVEKILDVDETLPDAWPVDGTTGYDFLNQTSGLFVDPLGEMAMTTAYARFTGEDPDFAAVAHAAKHLVMQEAFASDVNRLTELAVRFSEHHRRYRDYTRHELHEAIRELLASLGVYRTYVEPGGGLIRSADERYMAEAVGRAIDQRPDLDPDLFRFLGDVVLGRVPGDLEAAFLIRFQQSSAPVLAKGVEDTAFYGYLRFVALNEVGGAPDCFGTAVDAYHDANAAAAERWPGRLAATSTHDTKRSEDVRARLALLSEIPEEWGERVARWHDIAEQLRLGEVEVDRNTEWLLYQTLVGAWPLPVDRAVAYMEKATREAKGHTSWTNPAPAYDTAVRQFVTSMVGNEEFTADLAAFTAPLVRPGRVNSLAQAVLKLAAPGVADIYQGSELWDLSLVDPDNRRPVDYGLRRRLLGSLDGATAAGVWARDDEGSAKLFVLSRGLSARRRLGDLGGYRPLWPTGPAARHVVGCHRDAGLVAVVPRLVLGLERRGGWSDTVVDLPDGPWRDVLTDKLHEGRVEMATLLEEFPVGLLERA